MEADSIYQETVPFPLILVVLLLLGAVAALMLGLLIYQLAVAPLGSRPAPDWYYLVMFLFLTAICALVANFRRLNISITSQGVKVSFGMIRRSIPWGEVEDCYPDETVALGYGGWGIRVAKVRGKWRLAYTVVGHSRVVLSLRMGRFREFVFSTRNPQEVLRIARQQLGR